MEEKYERNFGRIVISWDDAEITGPFVISISHYDDPSTGCKDILPAVPISTTQGLCLLLTSLGADARLILKNPPRIELGFDAMPFKADQFLQWLSEGENRFQGRFTMLARNTSEEELSKRFNLWKEQEKERDERS